MNRQMRHAWRNDIKRRKRKTMQVREFDSFEDAQAAMRKAEEEANAQLLEEQKAIGYGDYWTRPYPEYGIFVFGQVWSQEQTEKDEDQETIAMMRDSHLRGYRFGMAYSVIEPEGELGSTHVANMWPIKEEDFNDAKEHGWHITEEFVQRIFSEAQAAKRTQAPSAVDEPVQMEEVEDDA